MKASLTNPKFLIIVGVIFFFIALIDGVVNDIKDLDDLSSIGYVAVVIVFAILLYFFTRYILGGLFEWILKQVDNKP